MSSLSARALALLAEGWRGSVETAAYMALADRVRLLVIDGRIALDTRLPAERELAAQLGVSRTTVSAAYAALRDAGYLHSVRGSGSVARIPRDAHAGRPPAPAAGGTGGSGSSGVAASPYLDFGKASLPALPAVVGAARRAAEQLPAHLATGGFDPWGLPALRDALAARYTARGLPTSADQIVVTLGAQHAIALVARTLLSRGDRALVESPSYPHAYESLRDAGARLVPVSVSTDGGWDGAGLEQALQRTSPSLGYLMPDFHNPTGQVMPAEMREKVLWLAARSGTTLVADETMAELNIDARSMPLPFAAYTDGPPPGLIGSVGKTVWGGIRIGWIRADRSVVQRLVRARLSGDLGNPVLEQLLVLDLLGDFDAILAVRREQLRAGRDRLSALLAEQLPGWTVPTVAGGLTTWVNLGAPVSSQLALAARSEGLLIAAGPSFGLDGAFERFLRIPFSYGSADTERAVAALAAASKTIGRFPAQEAPYLAGVI